MAQTFAEYLSTNQADSDTVQQAARYYLAEITNDLDHEDMRNQLKARAEDPGQVDPLLQNLEQDPASIEQASLVLLSSAWDDSSQREIVESAVEDAKGKLAVIETAILAIVAMYGMYLLKTGGVKETKEVTKRNPDGSYQQTKSTEYASPGEPLRAVTDLFGKGDQDEAD